MGPLYSDTATLLSSFVDSLSNRTRDAILPDQGKLEVA